jgi:hypothetical protein
VRSMVRQRPQLLTLGQGVEFWCGRARHASPPQRSTGNDVCTTEERERI